MRNHPNMICERPRGRTSLPRTWYYLKWNQWNHWRAEAPWDTPKLAYSVAYIITSVESNHRVQGIISVMIFLSQSPFQMKKVVIFTQNKIENLTYFYLLNDLMTGRRLPDDYLMTAQPLPNNCFMTAWWLHDEYLTNAWPLPDNCMTTAWQLHDNCMITAWQLHDNCMTTAWRLMKRWTFQARGFLQQSESWEHESGS